MVSSGIEAAIVAKKSSRFSRMIIRRFGKLAIVDFSSCYHPWYVRWSNYVVSYTNAVRLGAEGKTSTKQNFRIEKVLPILRYLLPNLTAIGNASFLVQNYWYLTFQEMFYLIKYFLLSQRTSRSGFLKFGRHWHSSERAANRLPMNCLDYAFLLRF